MNNRRLVSKWSLQDGYNGRQERKFSAKINPKNMALFHLLSSGRDRFDILCFCKIYKSCIELFGG